MAKLKSFRKYHRIFAPIVLLPLLVTVITGVTFNLSEEWFKFPEKVNELIITIHKGGYLGEKLTPLYVLLNGLGLVFMLVTGVLMLLNSTRRQYPSE